MTLQVSCSISARLVKVTKRLAGSFGGNSAVHASFSWAASAAEVLDDVEPLQRAASNECWLKMQPLTQLNQYVCINEEKL